MIRIESFNHFIETITGINVQLNNDKEVYSRMYFRGHSDERYLLLPSIARKDENGRSNFVHEMSMINRARLRNPVELSNISKQINLLARLQHYGLNTRLLDITENALVALYFSSSNNLHCDGEVVVFNANYNSISSPDMLTTELYSLFSKIKAIDMKVDKFLEHFLNSNDIKKIVKNYPENVYKTLFKEIMLSNKSTPIFVEHEIQSEREIRQQAAFLLFPNDYDEENDVFIGNISPISKESSFITERIVIPKELKAEIIMNLRLFGITEDYIFPEFQNRCKAINSEIQTMYPEYVDYKKRIKEIRGIVD